MTVPTFDYLLDSIKHRLVKHSPRPSISPAERLAVTLRYLSTGTSFASLAQSFAMSDYTVGLIVKEVCKAIYENLQKTHLAVPTVEEFRTIAEGYEREWNFPNCIGALDGKHIRIKCPKGSGTMFYNYKEYYSVILQAVAAHNYKFLFIDVGAFGKQSDGGVFDASSLSAYMKNPENFPDDRVLEGLDIEIPYLVVVDDAYPLKRNMMKPHSHQKLSHDEIIFNGRLSRARRCVECAFGILANKWRVLLKSIDTTEEVACDIVKCLTVLHNVVIDREGVDSVLVKSLQKKVKSHERECCLKTGRKFNRATADALTIRNTLTAYFNSVHGSVPWQSKYLK